MSLRIPLQVVTQITDLATSGIVNYPFLLPQDIDCVVVKVTCGTFTGTTPTIDIYFQTTDDGGTTWYDCGNLGQITTSISNANARWASFQIDTAQSKGISSFISSVAASTAVAAATTGMPILSRNARISLKYGGTQLANNGVVVTVYANSQSARP